MFSAYKSIKESQTGKNAPSIQAEIGGKLAGCLRFRLLGWPMRFQVSNKFTHPSFNMQSGQQILLRYNSQGQRIAQDVADHAQEEVALKEFAKDTGSWFLSRAPRRYQFGQTLAQFLFRGGKFNGNILQDLHPGSAVRFFRWDFCHNLHAAEPAELQVISTIVQLLMGDDPAHATDRVQL